MSRGVDKTVPNMILLNTMLIRGGVTLEIIRLSPGDVARLKKPHPCGSDSFKIIRVGGIVRLRCLGCGRDMTIDRIKLEKSIKHINHIN